MKLVRLANLPFALKPMTPAARDRVVLQLVRIAACWSQFINCHLLGGHHDQTVSARCYVQYVLLGNQRWRKPYLFINWIFRRLFGQSDHCQLSHEADVAFAEEVKGYAAR